MSENIQENNQSTKKYMRAKEVSVFLGIGIATVWRYARDKKIKAKRLSERVTVFEVADIENFVNSVEVAS